MKVKIVKQVLVTLAISMLVLEGGRLPATAQPGQSEQQQPQERQQRKAQQQDGKYSILGEVVSEILNLQSLN